MGSSTIQLQYVCKTKFTLDVILQSYQGFTQAKCIANMQTDRIKVIFIYTTPTALKKITAFNSFLRAMFMPGLIYDIINLPPHWCTGTESVSKVQNWNLWSVSEL